MTDKTLFLIQASDDCYESYIKSDNLPGMDPHFLEGVYLHGVALRKSTRPYGDALSIINLEDFDVQDVDDEKMAIIPEGVYPAYVHGFKGKCLAYIWHIPMHGWTRMKGLVVSMDDHYNVEYAEKCYLKRKIVL